jgi:ribosome-binding protein aMBF1 (putative translation factor)
MIENIHNRQVSHLMDNKSVLPQSDPAGRRHRDDSHATLQVNFGDMVRRAREASDVEAQALERARELLASGRLTSPENIRAAAENIVTFGI